jgi:hypothetical protein
LVNHNLPVQVTSFVGRSEEIAAALRLLSGSRIVTLLGPGGTGKSRLALQVAAEAAEDFGDGVFFVPLASVTDPELIPSAILGAMGVSASSGGARPPNTSSPSSATRRCCSSSTTSSTWWAGRPRWRHRSGLTGRSCW